MTSRSLSTLGASRGEVLDRLLKDRFSCRAFQSTPVSKETTEVILGMAQRTASWCNLQPWHVIVTTDDETARLGAKLAAHSTDDGGYDIPAPAEYFGEYRERRRTAGFGLYNSLGIARDDLEARREQALRNYSFFGAPHVAVISCDDELGPYAYVDCGGYIANFMLAATSLGVATIAQASVARLAVVIREHFVLPDERTVLAVVAFGYAEDGHPANAFRTERAPIQESVRWKGFASESPDSAETLTPRNNGKEQVQ